MDASLSFSEITSPDPPSRFLIVRDGNAQWTGDGFEDIHLSADGAAAVIADFKRQGNALPIDYHHASLKVEETKQGEAPAAGWINDLEYVPGEGLYATEVEWTDKAAAQMKAREFKYWSPVIFRDDDESIFELHSVALTNRPRTREMKELLKAAHRAANSQDRRIVMPKPKTTKKVAAGQEEEITGEPMGAVTTITPEQKAMVKLMELLELPDEAPLVDVLNAAIDKITPGDGESDGEDSTAAEADAAHKVAAALGSDAKTLKAVCAEIDGLKVKAGAADAMGKRVKVLEAASADRDKKERDAKAAALVDSQVEAGRLLPDDEKAMAAARALACSDPDGFMAIYDGMPAIIEPGAVVTPSKRKNEREKIIASASLDYDSNPVYANQCSRASWTNVDLRNAGLAKLNEDETKALA